METSIRISSEREREREHVDHAFPLREVCRQDYDFIQDVSSCTCKINVESRLEGSH